MKTLLVLLIVQYISTVSHMCVLIDRMYELPANLLIDCTLEITVMDHNLLSANEFISKTKIDLKNCYLTKYMALCGLSQSFHKLVITPKLFMYIF